MDFGVLRRWWPVAAVTVLLALAAFAAGHSAIGASRIPPAADTIPYVPDYPSPEAVPSIPVEPRDVGESTSGGVPGWLATAAVVLLSAAVLGAVGYVLWNVLRGALRRTTRAVPVRRTRRTAEGTAREVVAALDAGLVELDDRSTDPRTAVIACWVRLEEAAEDAGVPRHTGDTPTDLVGGCCAATRRPASRRSPAPTCSTVSRTSTGRPGTPRTRSTSTPGTRPAPRCAGCAAS